MNTIQHRTELDGPCNCWDTARKLGLSTDMGTESKEKSFCSRTRENKSVMGRREETSRLHKKPRGVGEWRRGRKKRLTEGGERELEARVGGRPGLLNKDKLSGTLWKSTEWDRGPGNPPPPVCNVIKDHDIKHAHYEECGRRQNNW